MGRKLLIVLITGLVMFLITEQIPAAAENIKDCVEEGADCPKLNGDTGSPEDQEGPEAANKTESPGSMVWKLVQMGFALILILGLIYGLLYLLSKRGKMFSGVQTMESMGAFL
ncbi:hypothetical protein [Lentibacillus sp. JNUCC-1]|uniref:hypothetical protein n=1 Tax=Lentibacillus sp. JNUCC-1 TaxID=2654513 RepID=UPI001E51667E|nr:hypothetical protein [Lentibacillus sp. JNUCC-1]